MARGTRRFWWSLGFAVGFVIRDLMEDESCVRTGLRNLYHDVRRSIAHICCPTKDCPPAEPRDESPPSTAD